MQSTDELFNFGYRRALYRAYTDGFLRNASCTRDSAIVCGAAKYIDADGVKSRLLELLGTLAKNNSDDDIDGRLYVACGVIDYAEFTHDYAFLDECVQNSDKYNATTVAKLCLEAALTALCRSAHCDTVKETVRYRQIIDIMRYFGNGSNNSERLRICINKAVYKYAQNLKSIKYIVYKTDNVFETLEYAFLLFRSGEYGGAYGALQRGMRALLNKEGTVAELALFYTLVTQQFLGVSFAGERMRICPRLARNIGDIRFDVNTEKGNAHIAIDNSVSEGDWMMRVDNISYCSGSISINKQEEKTIVFKRNGKS